ncbi:MAG: hypothetical protein ACX98W_02535 [bacterium]
MQVAVLLGLAACAGSDAGGPRDEGGAGSSSARAAILQRWIDMPPEGCGIGSSGPTLNPRDSIRSARLAAIEALAVDALAVDVQSITGDGSDGSFAISAQALSGVLADARVVALWADTDPRQGVRSRVRQVFALACWPDVTLRELPAPDYPGWLLDPPEEGGRICAVGIAGPTWRSEDQPVSALRDARLAIAVALESRVEKRIFDSGRGVARIARQVDPSAAALSRAAAAESLESRWLDEAGTGPVGLPGVLYGLACIDD